MKHLSNQKYHSWKPFSRVSDYNILQLIVFHHPNPLRCLTFFHQKKQKSDHHHTVLTPAATLMATEMNRSNVGSLPTARVKYPSAAGITCRSGTPWSEKNATKLDELEIEELRTYYFSTESGKNGERLNSRVNYLVFTATFQAASFGTFLTSSRPPGTERCWDVDFPSA